MRSSAGSYSGRSSGSSLAAAAEVRAAGRGMVRLRCTPAALQRAAHTFREYLCVVCMLAERTRRSGVPRQFPCPPTPLLKRQLLKQRFLQGHSAPPASRPGPRTYHAVLHTPRSPSQAVPTCPVHSIRTAQLPHLLRPLRPALLLAAPPAGALAGPAAALGRAGLPRAGARAARGFGLPVGPSSRRHCPPPARALELHLGCQRVMGSAGAGPSVPPRHLLDTNYFLLSVSCACWTGGGQEGMPAGLRGARMKADRGLGRLWR